MYTGATRQPRAPSMATAWQLIPMAFFLVVPCMLDLLDFLLFEKAAATLFVLFGPQCPIFALSPQEIPVSGLLICSMPVFVIAYVAFHVRLVTSSAFIWIAAYTVWLSTFPHVPWVSLPPMLRTRSARAMKRARFSPVARRAAKLRRRRRSVSRTPGYCYLAGLPPEHRSRAFRELGAYPKTAAFTAFCLFTVRLPASHLAGLLFRHAQGPAHIVGHDASRFGWRSIFRRGVTRGIWHAPRKRPRGLTSRVGSGESLFEDSPQRSAVLSPNVTNYLARLRRSRVTTPVAVPDHMAMFLERAGLEPANAFAPRSDHPVHVCLERQALRLVAGLLRNVQWYALWISPEKLVDFPTQPVGVFNKVNVAKDFERFRSSASPVDVPSSPAQVWFLHDTLHHLTPREVGTWFDDNPHLQYVIGTIVAPSEVAMRSESLWPKLYRIIYGPNNTFEYIPEGDRAGSYRQSCEGVRWGIDDRLITPMGECVHIGKIGSRFAHQTVIISRPQLLPGVGIGLDRPDLITIPRWVMPFSSPAERYGIYTLFEKLEDYSLSLPYTDFYDLYTKMRQLQMTENSLYSSALKKATVRYVMARRAFHLDAPVSRADWFMLSIAFLTAIPVLPLSWVYSQLVGIVAPTHVGSEPLEELKPRLFVSAPDQWVMPKRENLCPVKQVSLHYIPPDAGRSGRIWIRFAAISQFFFIKLFGGLFYSHFDKLVRVANWLAAEAQYRFALGFWTLPAALCGLALSSWWNINTEEGWQALYAVLRTLRNAYSGIFSTVWSVVWGLPSSGLHYHIGYGASYKFLMAWIWVTFLWRNSLRPFPAFSDLWNVPYTPLWYGQVVLTVFLLYHADRTTRIPRDRLPFHRRFEYPLDIESYQNPPPEQEMQFDPPVIPGRPESPLDSTLLRAPDPTYWTALRSALRPRMPGHLSPPVTPVPVVVPLPVAVPPVIPPAPPPAVPYVAVPAVAAPPPGPGHPALVGYRLDPMSFVRLTDFHVAAQQLNPVAPVLPNLNQMCVWDCVGALLGLDPVVAWAIFIASAPDWAAFANGTVQQSLLPRVFAFYRLGGTIASAELERNGTTITSGDPPFDYGQAAPGWPTFNWSLIQQGGANSTFHLMPQAARVRNMGAPAVPGAFDIIGLASRFVPLAEMQQALNLPVNLYNRIVLAFQNFAPNPASFSAYFHSVQNLGAPVLGVLPPPVVLPRIPLAPQRFNYATTVLDVTEGQHLASDLKLYPNEMELSDTGAASLARSADAIMKHAQPTHVDLTLLHGAPGTGKTNWLIGEVTRLLATGVDPTQILVVTYNQPLKGDVMGSMLPAVPALRADNFWVGYKALISGASYVFIDDAGQCVPGYLSLLFHCLPNVERWYLTFDCCQATNVFAKPNSLSRSATPTRRWLAARSTTYATEMRRVSEENSTLMGFPVGPNPTHGQTFVVSKPPRDVPLLVASPRFSEGKNKGGALAFAFSECQGLTMRGDVAIDLGGTTAAATDAAIFTALTRATGNIWLVVSPMVPALSLLQEQSYGVSMILSAMLAVSCNRNSSVINQNVDVARLVALAVQSHMSDSLGPVLAATLGLNPPIPVVAGTAPDPTSWADRSRAARAHPAHELVTPNTFLPRRSRPHQKKAAVTTWDRDRHLHRKDKVAHLLRQHFPMTQDTSIVPDKPVYVVPARRVPHVAIDPVLRFDRTPRDPDEERVYADVIEPTQVRQMGGPPEAQHHKRSDRALDAWSKHERTPPRRDEPGLNSIDRKRFKQLRSGVRKFFLVPEENQAFDEGLWEQAMNTAMESWVSGRTLGEIEQALKKWEPDADRTFIRLFLKSQWLKKLETRGGPVKKGQVIADVCVWRTFEDAVWATYLELVLDRWKRPTTLMFSKMNPSQLQEWYSGFWKPGTGCTANDYTGWDIGVDRVFLQFDLHIMERAGIPPEYRDVYFHFRTQSTTYLGPFPIMQASGDRWTWLLNSLRNAALTGASYSCPAGTPAAFCGDDSALCGLFSMSKRFNSRQWPMVPKPAVGSYVDFCGFSFGKAELTMSARSLAYRARIGLQRGVSQPDFWRSVEDMFQMVDYDDYDALGGIRLIQNTVENLGWYSFRL